MNIPRTLRDLSEYKPERKIKCKARYDAGQMAEKEKGRRGQFVKKRTDNNARSAIH